MQCYRSGGCGPYEMYSCSECPASKPEYVNAQYKWIQTLVDFENGTVTCPACNLKVKDDRIYSWETEPSYKFCPYCGVRVEGLSQNR